MPGAPSIRGAANAKATSPGTVQLPSATALLFVGQGAQTVGMTVPLLESMPKVAEMYATAERVLGYDLLAVVRDGPSELLSQTLHAQPALLIAGLAAAEKLRSENPLAVDECVACAGLSLGEYTALVFAGALSFEAALEAVAVRARAMHAAGEAAGGIMATVVGLEDDVLAALCGRATDAGYGGVWVANFLFPKGRVVAGNAEAVARLKKLVTAEGAKSGSRLIFKELAVSGAFHTELMAPAADELRHVLDTLPISDPRIPVIANATGLPYRDADDIRAGLVKQLTSPVLWDKSIETLMKSNGAHTMVDVGPRAQIKAMLRKIDPALGSAAISVEV